MSSDTQPTILSPGESSASNSKLAAEISVDAERTIVCTLTNNADARALDKDKISANTWDAARRPGGSWPLPDAAARIATAVLCDRALLRFDMRETRYADPAVAGQNFSLFSFVPATGARPDKKGVFGFAKIRGTFETDAASREREEFLVRDVDSYHPVQTVRTGHPFPVVVSGELYAAETSEVEMKKTVESTIAADVRERRRVEREETERIKEREKKLLQKSKKNLAASSAAPGENEKDEKNENENPDDDDEESPLEKYTMLRMKKAQLIFTYRENKKKLDEVRDRAMDAVREIARIDETTPKFKREYRERIRATRAEVGMTTDFSDENFLRFVSDDFDLADIFGKDEIPDDIARLVAATSLTEKEPNPAI